MNRYWITEFRNLGIDFITLGNLDHLSSLKLTLFTPC
jgi:hypothetical protein